MHEQLKAHTLPPQSNSISDKNMVETMLRINVWFFAGMVKRSITFKYPVRNSLLMESSTIKSHKAVKNLGKRL